MDRSSEPYFPTASGGYPDFIPTVTITTGGVLLLVAAIHAINTTQSGAATIVAALDFLFFAAPGVTLVYTGFWMPRSNIGAEHYLRLVAVMFGGVAVMFGFILLRDIHPGVSVEWSIGTQALALTLGSIGGLLIGVQESASVISHDLRNPLNVAQGHIELARREVENEHLSTVADAHDRMTRLIEDLLTLAQEGETIDETEPADL